VTNNRRSGIVEPDHTEIPLGPKPVPFVAIESALYRNTNRSGRRSGYRWPRKSKLVCCGSDAVARDHREFWMPLLIRRDFSGLTLTADKPGALNSSVNRSFGTFVVFFTSN
jgi:hypothetical protein